MWEIQCFDLMVDTSRKLMQISTQSRHYLKFLIQPSPKNIQFNFSLQQSLFTTKRRKQTTNSTREEFLFIFDVCFCLSLRRKVCRAFFDDVSDAESSKVMLNSKAFEINDLLLMVIVLETAEKEYSSRLIFK
jgi:hypothetical protein